MTLTELAIAPSDSPEPYTDRLRLAVAACLARFKGSSREHTESDLRCYLSWCAERSLDPLAAPGAVHPVDARDPPVQALHRLPAVLRHSRVLPDLRPGQPPRALTRRARPPSAVPAEAPTLGFTHLQFEEPVVSDSCARLNPVHRRVDHIGPIRTLPSAGSPLLALRISSVLHGGPTRGYQGSSLCEQVGWLSANQCPGRIFMHCRS